MSDELADKGYHDRGHIGLDARDLRQWARHFGVPKSVLEDVVGKVGNSAAAVRKELETARKSGIDPRGIHR